MRKEPVESHQIRKQEPSRSSGADLTKPLLIVSYIGFAGLLMSLLLLYQFKEPIFKIVGLAIEGVFGKR